MDKLRVISADSHMTEPPDLWTVRLDRRFQEQAPRGVRRPDKPGHFSTAPGITPFPVAGGFSTGRGGEALKAHLNSGYEVARPSGWAPVERLTDQDINGVEAEVLYTIPGLALFQLSDVALQQACFRVCNDWVAGFRSHSPKRLHPVALIPLEEIPAAVAELHRVAKPGLKGGMIQGRSAKPSRLCPPPGLGHLSGRPGRSGQLSLLWRGELYVDLGFSAYRHHLAQLTPGHCPGLCRRTGPHHPQDRV